MNPLPWQTGLQSQQSCTIALAHSVGYINSPYLKDLYLYLKQNRLPSSKSTIHKVETLAERYILLDSLLFRLNTSPDKEKALLAIPEICADQIITLYHSILFAGHQGVIKTYLTIADKFFIPDLMHYLCSCIKGCHICQLSKKIKSPPDNSKQEYT